MPTPIFDIQPSCHKPQGWDKVTSSHLGQVFPVGQITFQTKAGPGHAICWLNYDLKTGQAHNCPGQGKLRVACKLEFKGFFLSMQPQLFIIYQIQNIEWLVNRAQSHGPSKLDWQLFPTSLQHTWTIDRKYLQTHEETHKQATNTDVLPNIHLNNLWVELCLQMCSPLSFNALF